MTGTCIHSRPIHTKGQSCGGASPPAPKCAAGLNCMPTTPDASTQRYPGVCWPSAEISNVGGVCGDSSENATFVDAEGPYKSLVACAQRLVCIRDDRRWNESGNCKRKTDPEYVELIASSTTTSSAPTKTAAPIAGGKGALCGPEYQTDILAPSPKCTEGFCCGREGKCGIGDAFCGMGCQKAFGMCGPKIGESGSEGGNGTPSTRNGGSSATTSAGGKGGSTKTTQGTGRLTVRGSVSSTPIPTPKVYVEGGRKGAKPTRTTRKQKPKTTSRGPVQLTDIAFGYTKPHPAQALATPSPTTATHGPMPTGPTTTANAGKILPYPLTRMSVTSTSTKPRRVRTKPPIRNQPAVTRSAGRPAAPRPTQMAASHGGKPPKPAPRPTQHHLPGKNTVSKPVGTGT
ncbi:hypothetical protein HK097_008715 [Rhizophlyctis rosea]|uniref:Chitin-binding type-1 domain-containing protein n=1 Tax=Rhizophlyctis rosea TaxID=64517 RepID=A0AAD5SBG9_9FUNG|nr:hypothetical protein HK097_008715 [Rhizophlyctis rosea]